MSSTGMSVNDLYCPVPNLVTPSPRDIATRFGIDQIPAAQQAYRIGDSLRYFARGRRFGEHLPTAGTLATSEKGAYGELQLYAQANTEGPGIFKWQHYFSIYERHLARFRGQAVTLIEVGVAGGGSVRMWRDYLGPAAQIVGVDIDQQCRRFEERNIEILIGDQGSPAFWNSVLDDHALIHVVIDDGGHLPEQQVITLESLLPRLAPGGVYICEDIHGPLQPFHSYIDGLTRPLSDIGVAGSSTLANPLQRQVASVHRYPLMTVIEKVSHRLEQFECHRYGSEWPEDWLITPAPESARA
jgi:hypothetical protein